MVNFDGQKIWASQIGLHTGTIHEQYTPGAGFVIDIGDWNMFAAGGGTSFLIVNHYFDVFYNAIKEYKMNIRRDSANPSLSDLLFYDNADPQLIAGGISSITETSIILRRRTGGFYDSVNYDETSYNRGWIPIHMREF